jgi:hypothetical protein
VKLRVQPLYELQGLQGKIIKLMNKSCDGRRTFKMNSDLEKKRPAVVQKTVDLMLPISAADVVWRHNHQIDIRMQNDFNDIG